MNARRRPRVGLVLGSGSARGWAHIGVIRALEQAGIHPDLVCGTSIGALVGAAYAAGELDRFEQWVRSLGIKDVVSLLDIRLSGGVLKGERLMEFFRDTFVDQPIEMLPMPFAAVATALQSGAEVWLREGSTVEAVRASIALPALFTPVVRDGQLLADGGLVNPVPVSLARAMGAEILVAVDLNSDMVGRHLREDPETEAPAGQLGEWIRKIQDNVGALIPGYSPGDPKLPSMLDVVASSITIMQVQITRSRMAGEPPDVIIAPRLAHLGLLDFHRANEAIAEGTRAAKAVLHSHGDLGIAAP
jgi:NTE family protein